MKIQYKFIIPEMTCELQHYKDPMPYDDEQGIDSPTYNWRVILYSDTRMIYLYRCYDEQDARVDHQEIYDMFHFVVIT